MIIMLRNRAVRFYYPYPRFPSLSITGSKCGLDCNHCGGHYLEHMANVNTPEKMKNFCIKLDEGGGTGVLVSGGSTSEGRVPLKPFFKTLKWVKQNTNLIINAHTGIVCEEDAKGISRSGVDIASVDIVGDEETIKGVYGLNYSVEEYTETLIHLKDAGIPTVAPHICVGLNFGRISGEYRALEVAGDSNPDVIVILGLIPTKGTAMAEVEPPCNEEIIDIISYAKEKYPETDVALGCMRSRKNKSELEWQAIEAGVDRIATASHSTLERAKKKGYRVKVIDGCCAIPRNLEHKALRIDEY